MILRTTALALIALAMLLVASPPVQAGTVDGTVEYVDNSQIQVILPNGQRVAFPLMHRGVGLQGHMFVRNSNTRVTVNGLPYRLDQLQPGTAVTVHFRDRTGQVIRIEAFGE